MIPVISANPRIVTMTTYLLRLQLTRDQGSLSFEIPGPDRLTQDQVVLSDACAVNDPVRREATYFVMAQYAFPRKEFFHFHIENAY